jgi:hypothetical protein
MRNLTGLHRSSAITNIHAESSDVSPHLLSVVLGNGLVCIPDVRGD